MHECFLNYWCICLLRLGKVVHREKILSEGVQKYFKAEGRTAKTSGVVPPVTMEEDIVPSRKRESEDMEVKFSLFLGHHSGTFATDWLCWHFFNSCMDMQKGHLCTTMALPASFLLLFSFSSSCFFLSISAFSTHPHLLFLLLLFVFTLLAVYYVFSWVSMPSFFLLHITPNVCNPAAILLLSLSMHQRSITPHGYKGGMQGCSNNTVIANKQLWVEGFAAGEHKMAAK